MKTIPYIPLAEAEILNIKTAFEHAKQSGINLAATYVKLGEMRIYNDRIERLHYDGHGRLYIRKTFFTVVGDEIYRTEEEFTLLNPEYYYGYY